MIPFGAPDCCGEAPPAIVAATPSASATDSADDEDAILELTSDRVEFDMDAGVVRATGKVVADYKQYHLTAADIWFDTVHRRGHAGKNVGLAVRGYDLKGRDFDFDIRNQQILVGPWSGIVPGRGRFDGQFLFLSPGYAYGTGASYSPCLADSPGYFLSSERIEWFPYKGMQHFEGENVGLHLSGATIARIPSIFTSIEPNKQEEEKRRAGRAVDTQLGFNAYEGAFAAGTGAFKLNDRHTGTIPIRLTQGRGVFVGTTQAFDLGPAVVSGDASYQTTFRGGTSGPRGNAAISSTLPGGPALSVGLGYRTDVAGQAVNRLPDFNLIYPAIPVGPLLLTPSARAGYIMEELSEKRAIVTSYRTGASLQPWRPIDYWETQLYGSGTLSTYLRRDVGTEWKWNSSFQNVYNFGVRNYQFLAPGLVTNLGAEANRVDGGSPFFFDGSGKFDAFFGGVSYQWTPTWGSAVGLAYSRFPSVAALQLTDVYFNLSYAAPCLRWSFGFHPLTLGIDFNYSFGVN